MRTNSPPFLWWLTAAFVTVAVAFIGGTFVAEEEASTIASDAESMRYNAIPSVERLTLARTAVRRLDASAEVLATSGSTDVITDVEKARAMLHEELAAYSALAIFPGEEALWKDTVEPEVTKLDEAVDRLEGAVRTQDSEGRGRAEQGMRGALDPLDEGLISLIELNAAQARLAAERIVASRQASVRLAAVLDAAAALIAIGAAVASIGAASRFTRRREKDAARLRTRIEDLNAFAIRLAHDVLSPLAAVTLSLTAIEKAHGDEATRRALGRAQRGLAHTRDLTNAIYEFARSGVVSRPGHHVSLRATVDETVRALREATAGPPPQVKVEPFEDREVECERGVLYCILSNLLSNAAKFSQGSPEPRITVRARSTEDRVRVEVEDTGPGFPPGFEESAFEPYVRGPGAYPTGLGLGLATVRRYVTAHGGNVGVRRVVGGSVVWFEMPCARRETAAAPSGVPSAGTT